MRRRRRRTRAREEEGDDKMVVVKEEPGVEGEDKGKDKKEGESEGEKKDEKKDEKKEESYGVAAADENGVPVCFKDLKDDTEDVDDLRENEHFDSRLSFLNLCAATTTSSTSCAAPSARV